MATNTLITNSIVLKEAMMLLNNELVVSKLCNRDYEPNFGAETKNGESIKLARPIRGQVRTGNVMQALLTLLLSEKVSGDATAPSTERSAEAEAIRRQIREGMEDGKQER